ILTPPALSFCSISLSKWVRLQPFQGHAIELVDHFKERGMAGAWPAKDMHLRARNRPVDRAPQARRDLPIDLAACDQRGYVDLTQTVDRMMRLVSVDVPENSEDRGLVRMLSESLPQHVVARGIIHRVRAQYPWH